MKKFLCKLSFFGALCALMASPMIFMIYKYDPLRQIRWSDETSIAYVKNQREMNPGLAKNYPDYDTIIAGTSLSENIDYKYFNSLNPANKLLKLSISGSTFYEQSLIVGLAAESNKKLQVVNWELSPENIIREEQFHKRYQINLDLYDSEKFNVFRYLLDNYYYRYVVKKLKHKGEVPSIEELNNWGALREFNEKVTLKNFYFDKTNPDFDIEKQKDNMNISILETVKKYPNIKFNFYIPPLSILYYQRVENVSDIALSKQMQLHKYLVEELMKYSNVKVYDFRTSEDIFVNLNNYKDSFHYSPEVNSLILKWITNDEHRINDLNILEKNSNKILDLMSKNKVEELTK